MAENAVAGVIGQIAYGHKPQGPHIPVPGQDGRVHNGGVRVQDPHIGAIGELNFQNPGQNIIQFDGYYLAGRFGQVMRQATQAGPNLQDQRIPIQPGGIGNAPEPGLVDEKVLRKRPLWSNPVPAQQSQLTALSHPPG